MIDYSSILLAILAAIIVIGTPIAAIVGLSTARRLDGEVQGLRRRLGAAEWALARLRDNSETVSPSPAPEPEWRQPETPPPPQPQPQPQPSVSAAPAMAGERALTERWLVWLGGITLALGGAFLVKYSAEQGLLGPAVRVSLGGLAGIGAVVLGHWLSRRAELVSALPWHVPPALVGGGVSMVFASLYAAYGLYDLMGPFVAFVALASTAAATVLLSLGHGPFVALLGLVGAFAVPLLVRSAEPNAFGLFAYLLVLSASALALLRWREWWWLAWAVLGGAAGWTLLWLVTGWTRGDELVVGLFLCALFGLFAAFRLGVPAIPALAGLAQAPMVRQVVGNAAVTVSVLALAVVYSADFSDTALALSFAVSLAFLAFAWFDELFDRVPWIAATLAVLVLAGWDAGLREVHQFADILDRPLPGEAGRFASAALAFAGLFGGAGFAAVGRCARPWRWAALSAGAVLAVLAVSYWRLSPLGNVWAWVVGALALGVVMVLAAERMARRRSDPGMEGALAAYAIGVIGALALAATFALEAAWLTVALALVVPGIAWVDSRLRVAGLRRVALLLAAAVLIRLGFNPYVLNYAMDANWLLYGYGLPFAAFLGAARIFRRSADDVLVAVLEAGAIAFAVLLVTFEIRQLTAGGLSPHSGYSLAERSLQTIAWLSGAAILFVVHDRSGRLVPLRGGQILLLVATAQAVLLQVLFGNPLLTGLPVGETLVVNQLLLSFAAPAILYGVHSRVAPPSPPWAKLACAILAVGFGLLWATLEVRHAFVGSFLRVGDVGQAEQWAYSVLYLVAGVAVLAGGIRTQTAGWRRAGLAIVLLVVAKVFLVDLSQTTGIWRALSFLGLGAGLMGIGWLYRRFVK